MGTELAAAYLDYGVDALKVVAAIHGVKPVDHGAGGVKWRRTDLDRIVDAIDRGDQPDAFPAVPQHDPAELALKRVRNRGARH